MKYSKRLTTGVIATELVHLLDTSVAILLVEGVESDLARAQALYDVQLSIVTVVELEGGVYRDPEQAAVRRQRLDRVLARLRILAFDEPAASAYGRIVFQLGFSRRKVLDRMIAATALVHDATLVTANSDDFAEVSDLQLFAW